MHDTHQTKTLYNLMKKTRGQIDFCDFLAPSSSNYRRRHQSAEPLLSLLGFGCSLVCQGRTATLFYERDQKNFFFQISALILTLNK